MKRTRFVIIIIAACLLPLVLSGQNEDDFKYMRSSLCMMVVEHPQLEYNSEIEKVFKTMKIPSRFNDHGLGVRFVRFANDKNQQRNIEIYSQENDLAKRFISKWFSRDKNTGSFNTKLLCQRGLYSATELDMRQAQLHARGMAVLEDLGENLISHTYWVVNDVSYVNHANTSRVAKEALQLVGGISKLIVSSKKDKKVLLNSLNNLTEEVKETGSQLNHFDEIKGFGVRIKSYLYRLKWNDDIAATFYSKFYTEDSVTDYDKVKAYEVNTSLFELEYVGEVDNKSSKTVMREDLSNEDVIRKVCTRAFDKNLADLQHKFEEFRIKAPLVSIAPLRAYVGMKEDITSKSKYEVLQPEKDSRGITRYKRIGVIKPIKGRIWDNRFMAEMEGTPESKLGATYFEVVSGKDFVPGMLIREIK